MIYVFAGLVILVFSFVIALFSLAKESREQKKEASGQLGENALGDTALVSESTDVVAPVDDSTKNYRQHDILKARIDQLSKSDSIKQKDAEENLRVAKAKVAQESETVDTGEEPFPWEEERDSATPVSWPQDETNEGGEDREGEEDGEGTEVDESEGTKGTKGTKGTDVNNYEEDMPDVQNEDSFQPLKASEPGDKLDGAFSISEIRNKKKQDQ